MRILLTRLKILLLSKEALFWFILFPVLLASAEYLAFKDIITSTPIDTINIGISNEEEYKIDNILETVIDEASLDESKKLFNKVTYDDLDDMIYAVNNKDVDVIVYVENDKTIVKGNSTILINIVDSIVTETNITINVIEDVMIKYQTDLATNPNTQPPNVNDIMSQLMAEANYTNDLSNTRTGNANILYLYAIIALSCLYASIIGLKMMSDLRADRTSLGIRISTSSTSKTKLTIIYFIACLIINVIGCLIVFGYYKFILNISLGNPFLVILTMIIGGITGTVLGMVIGTFVSGKDKVREGIISAGSLFLCMLSGMCSIQIKTLIDQNAPFINYINPAALITDSLYTLYYYDDLGKFIINISILLGISIVGFVAVMIKTRSQKYASL